MSDVLPVGSVVVTRACRGDGKDTLRLMGSIKRLGLLHPLVVNTRNELIAGRRRFEAVKGLGWANVPVTVVATLDDAREALRAEMQENTERLDLTPAELVDLGRRIEELERPRAKERQKAGGGKPGSGKLPEPEPPTRDKVAAALGVSGKTYVKAKAVVEAAEREPEKFGPVAAEMDRTGKVDPAYRKVKEDGPRRPDPFLAAFEAVEAGLAALKRLAVLRSMAPDLDPEYRAAVAGQLKQMAAALAGLAEDVTRG